MVEPQSAPAFPLDILDFWDRRIQDDLKLRMARDSEWEKSDALVRNSETGARHGNLVAEFVSLLHTRLLAVDPQVQVEPDDPDGVKAAEDVSIVAQSTMRVAGLRGALQEAVTTATWATVGWIFLGHPLDPFTNDILRSARAAQPLPAAGAQDEYREVDPRELGMLGLDTGQVQPFDEGQFDPLAAVPSPFEDEEPAPIFQPDFGYPWAESVDPRYIIHNQNARKKKDLDYITRLRFLTLKECKRLFGDKISSKAAVSSEFRSLFHTVEGQADNLFPDLCLVAETWIIRDRNNPEYNGWYLCHLLGETRTSPLVAINRPLGGMIPLVIVPLSRIKKLRDRTMAQELEQFADIFDTGIKAIFRSIERQFNKKWGIPPSVGMVDGEVSKVFDDHYTGEIKVQDPAAIKQIVEEPFDFALVQSLAWVKSLAQSTANTSDLERGQAIKDITAKQTQALLDVTGISLEGMKDPINDAAKECVMKIMHLIGLFNHLGRSRKYTFGKKVAEFDIGQQDFTTSYKYAVSVVDNKNQVTNEERVVWLQLLKSLFADTGGVLLPYLDREAVTKETLRTFGKGPDLLASQGAGRPGVGPGLAETDPTLAGAPEGQVQPGQLSAPQLGSGGPLSAAVQDGMLGQHRERGLGDQGVGRPSNAVNGALRIGSGGGE